MFFKIHDSPNSEEIGLQWVSAVRQGGSLILYHKSLYVYNSGQLALGVPEADHLEH